jgi:hypothetical protein
MVSIFNRFRGPQPEATSGERPQGLKVCGGCTIAHVSKCGGAISEITQKVAGAFAKEGATFDPTDSAHLDFLESQLKPSGLALDRNDKALMAQVRQAARAQP